jgi:MFS transporter, PPP family, 3-phenylpropionic acid transporter
VSEAQHVVPYWRLSRFYLFYYAVLGATIPYWSLFLKEAGFTVQAIGWLTAVMAGTRIISPNIWGWVADRTQQRVKIIQVGAFLGFAFCFGLFFARSFFWMALVTISFSFFWNAILAQFEVLTLEHLHDKRSTYSHVRLWGSIGFILAVMGLGLIFDYISVINLPFFMVVFLGLVWFSTLRVKERQFTHVHNDKPGLCSILKHPAVIALFVVYFLLQVAHGPYYTFFSIYLENIAYSRTVIGQLWALGVVAEVLLLLCMHRLIGRFTLRHIMLFGLLMTTLRWLMIAFMADHLGALLLAQCLHAFSFGALHAAGIEVVQRLFAGGHEGQGQALYIAVGFGAGNAVGAGLSGYLWSSPGPSMSYAIAAGISAVAMVIAFVGFRAAQFR